MPDTVSHDAITMDNWHSVSALPRYLEHDCKGLLEVIDVFARDVFDSSTLAYKKSSEVVCREAFQHYSGAVFKANVRPKWLGRKEGEAKDPDLPKKALELDGICEATSRC